MSDVTSTRWVNLPWISCGTRQQNSQFWASGADTICPTGNAFCHLQPRVHEVILQKHDEGTPAQTVEELRKRHSKAKDKIVCWKCSATGHMPVKGHQQQKIYVWQPVILSEEIRSDDNTIKLTKIVPLEGKMRQYLEVRNRARQQLQLSGKRHVSVRVQKVSRVGCYRVT